MFMSVNFCSGIFTLFFNPSNSMLIPNNPVNKGNNGSFNCEPNVAIPKIPDSANIKNAHTLFFSLNIKKITTAISKKAI